MNKTLSQIAAEPKSDQLNAADLVAAPRTITITKVTGGSAEQKLFIFFEGDNGKPWKPCKTCIRLMQSVWGIQDQTWPGKSVTLYNDPDVIFGGEKMGGIRISHISGLAEEKKIVLRTSKTKVKTYSLLPLSDAPAAFQLPTDPALLADAQENASRGVAAYTAFIATLSAEQKDAIRPHHKTLTATAKAADSEVPV